MSVEFTVTVQDQDFRQRMENVEPSLRKYLQQAVNETAQKITFRARQLAPVKTGRLMQSIYIQVVGDYMVKVACYVPYALFQELGTRYIAPRYFLTRALQKSASEFLQIMGLNLQYALSEVSGE